MTDTTRPEAALSPPELDEVIAHCDRFEAAWKAGAPVRIEDVLADAPQGLRAALFGQLLALEVELRRDRGDRPRPEDYRVRFHDHAAAISAAFARLSSSSDAPSRPDRASSQNTARDLLFGLLAFQNGFIDRDALLGAFNAWTAGKSRGLGDLLHERGSLDAARYELMNALVGEHLKQHGGDPEASLAALSSVDSARADLEQVADTAVLPALSIVGTNRPATGAGETALHVGATRKAGNRFRILQFHRKGGLGQIHVARDEELGRDVALKEILPEKAHLEPLRSRFVLEAEINGGLEHPGIVPIYSLGHYADGKPYYAMRFVQGDSLKEAIEEYNRAHPQPDPSTVEFRKLLARFIDVCETIAYAHSRGVLHRDLKPQNIMLGRYGEALIIDWGLAKATGKRVVGDSDAPEATLMPALGDGHDPTIGVLGSPHYMSPEQAKGQIESLGPATDVYGLGATLYHLLTGRPPIQSEPGESVESILEKVRHGAIAPPRSVNRSIPAALEAICLKALAQKAEDRFASAHALAEDIERWLADEPVSARPDPPLARASRWGRKHRTAVTSLVVLLVTSLAATSVGLVRINAERILTEGQRDRAIKAEVEATFNLDLAERERSKAQKLEAEARAVLTFLQDKVLAAARPEGVQGGRGHEITLSAAIDAAESSLTGLLPDQPLVEASIRTTLGLSYLKLGKRQRAIEQRERVLTLRADNLGRDHPDTLNAIDELASAYADSGLTEKAIKLHEEAIGLQKAKLGLDHTDTLHNMNNLAAAYAEAGRTAEAVAMFEDVVRLRKSKAGLGDPDTLASMGNLAGAYLHAGRVDDAIRLHEETLGLQKQLLSPSHADVLHSMSNLAAAYAAAGRIGEAVKLFEDVWKGRSAKLGPDNPATLRAMGYTAAAYASAGRIDEGLKLMEESVRLQKEKSGAGHFDTLRAMNNLAEIYLALSRWSKAEAFIRESLALRQERADEEWLRFEALGQLGTALTGQQKFAEAEPLLVEAYYGLKSCQDKIPRHLLSLPDQAGERLISLYDAWGKPDQAKKWRAKLGLIDLPADVFARP